MSIILLLCQILLAAALLQGQQENPLVYRATRTKVIFGRGQMKNGVLPVRLEQHQWFTDSRSYSVFVQMEDSSTASTPDSLRFFTVKNFNRDRFTIRSPRFSADTVRVRWMAVGE